MSNEGPGRMPAPTFRGGPVNLPRFKLVTSNSLELFEERLNGYVEQLDRNEVVVDVKFATVSLGETLEYTALVQTQKTEAWT